MKNTFLLFVLTFTLFYSCKTSQKEEVIDYQEFKNPSIEYRAIPFYSLNDKLDTNELKRQLIEFKKGGFGGSYLHSRIGLLTEYLGEEWWQAMQAGVNVSDSLGIQAWFYDEDKWPSGFAGGLVPRQSEEYHGHMLVRINKTDSIASNGKILLEDADYYYVDLKYEMGHPWFNGTCWVDLMNPDMVKAFIDINYKPYIEKFKPHLGNTVKGIFTDEPNIQARKWETKNEGGISYSPYVLKRFKQENGYDLTPHLASLFDTIGNYKKIRIDYYRTVAKQFEESFGKQIGDYCKENNFVWTGHYLGEDSPLSNLITCVNIAPHYRHMQQPGIDHLFLRIDGNLHGAKQMTSVANQYGQIRRLSEAFGVSGQNMSFEDRKWIVDWHGLMGINHICPHLSLYSMKGERKRDYPPTISPQQPWWKYNKIVEDYSARICYFQTIGQQEAQVLVISPLESSFIDMDGTGEDWEKELDKKYRAFLKKLMQQHVTFDIGDEQILADTAQISNGKLIVGKMSYNTVILPYMTTIRSTTLALLNQLEKLGIDIFYVDYKPQLIDATKSKNEILKNSIKITISDIKSSLNSAINNNFEITGDSTQLIWYSKRTVKNGNIYQLSNTSRLQTVLCSLKIKGKNLILWDPANVKCFSLSNEIILNFAPAQTYFITTGQISNNVKIENNYQYKIKQRQLVSTLDKQWTGKRLSPNAITLDFASYLTSNHKVFARAEPVIGIHRRLEKEKYNGPLTLLFKTMIETVPENCSLVIEQPEMYELISINGTRIEFNSTNFYRDHSFKMQKISSLLKSGENSILLKLNYTAPISDSYDAYERYGTEIESIYLTGDFGVFAKKKVNTENFTTERAERKVFKKQGIYRLNDFYLTSEKTIFSGNDLILKGYPFYNGEFFLTQNVKINKTEGKKYILTFEQIDAIVASIKINNIEFSPITWQPWELDITKAIKNGENNIELILTNSLRNLLGPHHHIRGELVGVSPSSFTGKSSWTSKLKGENDWYDKRLTGQTQIWVDDYFFVPLGINNVKIVSENK